MIFTYAEIVAAVSGLCAIYLAAKNNILNWLFGALMVAIYIFIFYQVRLYADMALQVFFLLMQGYGWYQWRYGGENHERQSIQIMPYKYYAYLAVLGLVFWLLVRSLLLSHTDSTQVNLDVLIATLSILAQWMMSKKYIENWGGWIIVNILSCYLYCLKSLFITAGLSLILLGICFYACIHWSTLYRNQFKTV